MAIHRFFTPADMQLVANDARVNSQSCHSGLDILVVDDNALIRKILISSLTAHLKKNPLPFHIEQAENGEIAVAKAAEKIITQHSDYDLVLMDCDMPVLKGPEATLQIRDKEKQLQADAPSTIVTCSASATEKYIGADAIIKKDPIDLKTLKEIVDQLVRVKFEHVHQHLQPVSCA